MLRTSRNLSKKTKLPTAKYIKNVRTKLYVILMGLPGSGKSSLASSLLDLGAKDDSFDEQPFHVVASDEVGRGGAFYTSINHGLAHNEAIVVDRVSGTEQFRQGLVSYARTIPKVQRIELVFFNCPEKICIDRCMRRIGHPTLPPDNAAMVVRSLKKTFEPPSEAEKDVGGGENQVNALHEIIVTGDETTDRGNIDRLARKLIDQLKQLR